MPNAKVDTACGPVPTAVDTASGTSQDAAEILARAGACTGAKTAIASNWYTNQHLLILWKSSDFWQFTRDSRLRERKVLQGAEERRLVADSAAEKNPSFCAFSPCLSTIPCHDDADIGHCKVGRNEGNPKGVSLRISQYWAHHEFFDRTCPDTSKICAQE
eukprot:1776691-Amphidinium_carterae.1